MTARKEEKSPKFMLTENTLSFILTVNMIALIFKVNLSIEFAGTKLETCIVVDAPLLSLAFPDFPCHCTNHNNILLCVELVYVSWSPLLCTPSPSTYIVVQYIFILYVILIMLYTSYLLNFIFTLILHLSWLQKRLIFFFSFLCMRE